MVFINYLMLNDIVDIKPIIREVNNAINKKIEDGMFKDKNIGNIEIRKFILAQLIENLSTWDELGDWLPTGLKINEDKVINVVIVQMEVK